DSEAALPCPGPDRRERELVRSDAAPGAAEVAGVDLLHAGRAWRVVGGHEIDDALAERLPQALAILPRADRRGAFVGDGAVGDLFGRKGEVVRAGLGGDRQPLLPRAPQDGQD